MPVSPDIGSAHAGPVADLMTQVELQMLETAVAALRGDQTQEQWAAQALAGITRWRTLAERGVAGALAELGKAVRAALLGAQADGVAQALVDLPGVPSAQPLGIRGISLSETKLTAQLAAALQHTPRLLEAVLREAVRAGVDEVRAGTSTRQQASQHVLNKLIAQGVTGFRDSAGRNWSLSSYTEMAVRTETQAAALDAGEKSLLAAGIELVFVSDSPRECPVCRPYEGEVLDLTGPPGQPPHDVTLKNELGGPDVTIHVLTSLVTARAAGFQHPNCTHSFSGVVPGATELKPAHANPDGYGEKQHQRYLERKVREWKRAQVLALDDTEAAYAAAKVRDWQKALRDYVKEHDLKRQPGRESVTRAV